MIDINLGNLHLEVIGKEPDGFPHCAEAGTPRRLKQRGRCRRACVEEKTVLRNLTEKKSHNTRVYNGCDIDTEVSTLQRLFRLSVKGEFSRLYPKVLYPKNN